VAWHSNNHIGGMLVPYGILPSIIEGGDMGFVATFISGNKDIHLRFT
tara:strand:- start:439 stop:579 length:141 start_codon:yes stop_codon:yes gene_type:complete